MKFFRTEFFKSNTGLTLVEALIAAAISSGIFLISADLVKQIEKEVNNAEERTDVMLDKASLSKVITDELLASAPSYGFLKTDSYKGPKSDFWTITDKDLGPRVLELINDRDCFSMLIIDTKRKIDASSGTMSTKKILSLPPSYFYHPRANMTAPLVYDSNKLNTIAQLNNLNAEDQLIKLSGSSPIYDANGFYKDYGMILKMNEEKYKENNSIVSTFPIPSDCSKAGSSVDIFMRCLPSPGGGVTNLFITPVNLVKYCFSRTKGKGFTLKKVSNGKSFEAATNMKFFRLIREKSSSPLINTDLGFCAVKDQDPNCN